MSILPYRNITYKSPLSGDQIIERIADRIELKKNFRLRFKTRKSKLYEGSVYRNKFRINKLTYYQNAFIPIIQGEVHQDPDGTVVNVSMRMHEAVYVFMTLWLGIIAVVLIFMILLSISKMEFSLGIIIPLGMLLMGYFFSVIFFNIECDVSKKDLEEMMYGIETD